MLESGEQHRAVEQSGEGETVETGGGNTDQEAEWGADGQETRRFHFQTAMHIVPRGRSGLSPPYMD